MCQNVEILYICIYDQGATGRFAAFINKKYKSHRRVPAALENGILTLERQAKKTIYEEKIGKGAKNFVVVKDVEDESAKGAAKYEEKEAGFGSENDSDPEFDEEIADVEAQDEVSSGSDGEAEYGFLPLPPRSRRPNTLLNDDFVLEHLVYTSSDEEEVGT